MLKLKDILSEIGTDPKTVFGNIVFGDPDNYPSSPFRELQGFSQESEPNTEDEEEIFTMLQSWVKGGNRVEWVELYDKIYTNYNLFKRAASIYPKIFKPQTPNGTDLYRGVQVSKSLIEQLQNSSREDFDVFEHDDTLYKYKTPINYIPRSNVQSWSTNPKTAAGFSRRRSDGVILTTKQNDEYLFNQEVLRLLSLNKFDEQEVIHFGKTFSNDVYIVINRYTRLYKKIMFGDKF
jgi:hypothetical protein